MIQMFIKLVIENKILRTTITNKFDNNKIENKNLLFDISETIVNTFIKLIFSN